MIFKSFEINKINKKINQLILLYGKNDGLKNEALNILIKDENNIQNYEEKEILDNENNFIENILSKSLFETEKFFIIKRATDKILKIIENLEKRNLEDTIIILNSENLEKKSKLRILFEKDKKCICVPFYPDNEQTLSKLAYEFFNKNKISISQSNINLIINKCGGDRERLLNEIRKVEHFTKNGKKIALLRNVELKHSHGGSSRRNPKTTAITKSEVVTSSHVFIHEHTQGLNRFALHLAIMVNTLASWLLRTILTLPFFWRGFFRANLFTLVSIIKYYLSVMIRQTWKSKRLKNNES